MRRKGQYRKMEAVCAFICVNGCLSVNVILLFVGAVTGSMLCLLTSSPYLTCSLCLNWWWISLSLAWPEQCVPDLDSEERSFSFPHHMAMPPRGQQPGPPHTTAEILCRHQMDLIHFQCYKWSEKDDEIYREAGWDVDCGLCTESKSFWAKVVFHDTQVDPSSSFPTVRSSCVLINGLRCRLFSSNQG